MKHEFTLERIDNGYVLTADKIVYFCSSDSSAARLILRFVRGIRMPMNRAAHMARLHKGTVDWSAKVIGVFQKNVCEVIERDGFGTVESIASGLWPKYEGTTKWQWTFKTRVQKTLYKLVAKGYVMRHNKNSQKYYLTDKRPEGFIFRKERSKPEPKQPVSIELERLGKATGG